MFRLVKIPLALCVMWVFALQAHAEAVDFSLPDIDGKTRKLSDYRG